MSNIRTNLGRSSTDERLGLLLTICDVKEHLRNGNKSALRDIAAVVGGDPSHAMSFEVTVKQWLEEFKVAISRIALSSGFKSTGLTAALTHNSFIASTGGINNGICFDELTDFNDPTGVLAGPIEVVTEKVAQLTAVSGASSLSLIRANNFSRSSGIENELKVDSLSSRRFERGEKTVYGQDTCGHVGYGASGTFANTSDQVPKAVLGARTTLVGPRLVYPFKLSDELTVEVRGGLSRVVTTGDAQNTTLVTSRYVIMGKIDKVGTPDGWLGGLSNAPAATNAYMTSPTDVATCHISDVDLAKLQSGPVRIGAGVGAGTAQEPTIVVNKMPGSLAATYYGMVANSVVMIPVTGLDDVKGSKIYGQANDVAQLGQADGVAPATHAETKSSGGRMELNSGRVTYINVNRYYKLATAYTDIDFDVMMVMDLTSVLEDGGLNGTAMTQNDISLVHSHSLVGVAAVSAPSEPLLAIADDGEITPNVISTRHAWQNSDIIQLIRGYDSYSRKQGGDQIVNRALSETVSSCVRNDSFLLNNKFRTTLKIDGLIDNANADQVYEKLQDEAVLSKYIDGLDENMWIGPDEGAERLRVLTSQGKLSVLRKWMRVLDYLALIAKMTIDYSDGMF